MNPRIQFESPAAIEEFQSARLKEQLEHVIKHSPFYREHLSGIDLKAIRSVKDLAVLPETTKQHLQQKNMDFLCVDSDHIIDYITTSGTTGDPITFALTEKDLERLTDNEYASFICAGGSEKDIYQLMLTLDRRFMA